MARLFSSLLLAAGLLTAYACFIRDAAAPVLPAAKGSFVGTINQALASCTLLSLSPAWGPRRDNGASRPVFLPLSFNNVASPSFESPVVGTTILSPAQAAALLANGVYVNLHTASQLGGEIRANLIVK